MRRIIGRTLTVAFGFLAAIATTIFVAVWIGLERATTALHSSEDAWRTAFGWLRAGWQIPLLVTLLLASTVVVVGEVARIRSALFYIASGGMAVAGAPLMIEVQRAGAVAGLPVFVWPVLATAGFCGGAVYWMIAGRWT
jgi:hypothetical protein